MEESDITLLTFSGVAVQAMAEGAEVDRLAAAAVVHCAHGVGEVIAGRGAHSLIGAVGEELHAVRTKAVTASFPVLSLLYTAFNHKEKIVNSRGRGGLEQSDSFRGRNPLLLVLFSRPAGGYFTDSLDYVISLLFTCL